MKAMTKTDFAELHRLYGTSVKFAGADAAVPAVISTLSEEREERLGGPIRKKTLSIRVLAADSADDSAEDFADALVGTVCRIFPAGLTLRVLSTKKHPLSDVREFIAAEAGTRL